MKNATMLYKCPGPHPIHSGHFDTKIIDEDEIEVARANGWHLTTTDAKAAHVAAIEAEELNRPASRDEMKFKATELGLTFPPNISTVKLAEMIEQALAPKG